MTTTLRRAGAFALVGTFVLAAPALGAAVAAPFAAVAVLAVFVVDDGPLFDLFARPGDYEDGQLNGLAGFALAATGLALLSVVPQRGALPLEAFVAAVLVLPYGNLGAALVDAWLDGRPSGGTPAADATDGGDADPDPAPDAATLGQSLGFVAGGVLAGTTGLAVVASRDPGVALAVPRFLTLAATGAVLAALLRTVLFERDDPWIVLTVGLALGLLATLVGDPAVVTVAVAVAATVALAYASFALGAASVAGMLTGVLVTLLVTVLGGLGWFGVLVTFFGLGSLSTKFRYDAKLSRGVAEPNEGARGTANVLGNAAVALVAVVGFAAAPAVDAEVARPAFLFAFAGSLAAALSDTLSSEVGGLFDGPRLITTLEPVPPGTDGGVTWQGELAGLAGAGVLAGLSALVLPLGGVSPSVAGGIVAVGGVAGMTVDSVLGATLEDSAVPLPVAGRVGVGNEAVNFTATLAGGVVAAALGLAVATGLPA